MATLDDMLGEACGTSYETGLLHGGLIVIAIEALGVMLWLLGWL